MREMDFWSLVLHSGAFVGGASVTWANGINLNFEEDQR